MWVDPTYFAGRPYILWGRPCIFCGVVLTYFGGSTLHILPSKCPATVPQCVVVFTLPENAEPASSGDGEGVETASEADGAENGACMAE